MSLCLLNLTLNIMVKYTYIAAVIIWTFCCFCFLCLTHVFRCFHKQNDYPVAFGWPTHPWMFFEMGRVVCAGLWAASKRWTRLCDYFSICSFVIYTDSMQIKRSCYIWHNSPSCTINSREGHLLLSNLCYIKAARITRRDWLTVGLQWQKSTQFHTKKLAGPKALKYYPQACKCGVWVEGYYLIFVHSYFRIPYFFSTTFVIYFIIFRHSIPSPFYITVL